MAACSGVLLSAPVDSISKGLTSGWASDLTSCGRLSGWAVELKAASSLAVFPGPSSLQMVAMAPSEPFGLPMKGQRWSMKQRWQEFFKDPSQWWNYDADKTNPRSVDYKHKQHAQEGLWIQGWLNPPWVKEKVAAAMTEHQEECGKDMKSKYRDKENSGRNVFQTFGKDGTIKIHLRGDFKHRSTNEDLWVNSYKEPAWVDKAAPAAQLIQSCTSTMTTGFGRTSREGVSTIASGTSGHVKRQCEAGQLKEALHTLKQEGLSADSDTYVCLLQKCIKLNCLAAGKQVHTHIILSHFKPNVFLQNTLVNMYAKCGSIVDAQKVFDNMPEHNMFSWTIMMAGYTKHGCSRNAFQIYERMIQEGLMPDQVTFVCILKACASLAALDKGKKVHADIMKAGVVPDVVLDTALVHMYAKCGSIKDAKVVFDNMAGRNVVSWNAMITGYSQHGCGTEALETYKQMMQEGVKPNQVTFVCVLNACASLAALVKGKEVHADIRIAGIVPNIILDTALVDMYAKCGSIEDAILVFNNMAERNVVSWNVMIAGYVQHGCGMEALETYEEMMWEGVKPDQVTFICVCNACASLAAMTKGKEVHADILKAEIIPNISLANTLVDMYAKCGSIENARTIFDSMAERNVVSWNSMITGYVQHGSGVEALETYEQMMREGVKPDQVTFVCVCNACASLAALEKGKKVHGDIMKAGIVPSIILNNTLVHMYAKCGSIEDAMGVFYSMGERNVVSWNSMLAGYAHHGCGMEALDTYEKMMDEGLKPDQVTFVCILNACASLAALEKGKEVHADIMKVGVVPNIILNNTLVDMYASCGSIKDAKRVFGNMVERNVVSWNAMMAGYGQHGWWMEALETYEQMKAEGVQPNQVTFVCVLRACASLAALENGKEVHGDIIKAGIVPNAILKTALVDMYAKCGSIKDAKGVFEGMAKLDVVSWSAMISGYAQHGRHREALELFEGMQKEGFKPDCITFIGVLSACSHVGLVDEGRHYFRSLSQDHGLTPTVEHYGCMVDLLGRVGQLDEAEDFINKMPIKPDVVVWKALLGACRIHGNVEVAERAVKSILNWDGQDAATYVLLSNIYAAAGRWEDTAKVRAMMKVRGVRKEPGSSCIEVGDRVHNFMVDDKSHPQIEEIHAELRRLSGQMQQAGYVPDIRFVLHDMEEERKKFGTHS